MEGSEPIGRIVLLQLAIFMTKQKTMLRKSSSRVLFTAEILSEQYT